MGHSKNITANKLCPHAHTNIHTAGGTREERAKTSKIHIDIKANHFKIALSSGNSSVARATALKTSKGPFWGVCAEQRKENKKTTRKN